MKWRPGPKPVALDHNFPAPIVRRVAELVPDLRFVFISELKGDLHKFDDHDLVYELHRRACPVMVTQDHHMLDDVRVLVAVMQTRMTIVAIERTGNDPIRSVGVLLRDLLDIVRQDRHTGLAYRVRPSRVQPKNVRDLIAGLGDDPLLAQSSHGLPFAARTMYADDDVRRLR